MDYTQQFDPDDRERIFHFFAVFSRLECSLKRTGFVKRGSYGQAEANWNAYADDVDTALSAFSETLFLESKSYLLEHPPKRLDLVEQSLRWQPNPKRPKESGSRYLVRVVRDVRNNLFHGGKYSEPDGRVQDVARDRRLIDSASHVLAVCLRLHERVQQMFDEAA